MKPFLLNYLVCPIWKSSLDIEIFNEKTSSLPEELKMDINKKGFDIQNFNREIENGVLINTEKKIIYPLYRGVPRLLIFNHPLISTFKEEFGSKLQKFYQQGYSFPNDDSIPGERNVLASFSAEWTDYGYNEDVYWGQETKVYNNSLLSTLSNESQDLENKLVLEVGIGSGGSANFMCNQFKANLFGVDLGYSVDVAYRNFTSNPFFHIVQASVFNLPFKPEQFDFVYSHGVIHHTFSTKQAFDQISRMPKKGGRLYVWVYSFLNEQRTLKRRVIMGLERLIRPWCSRLPGWLQTIVLQPITPLYIFHQNTVHSGKKGMAKYSWREALHAARDRFTPKYIHRHSEEEMSSWFMEKGYEKVRPLSVRKLPDYVPVGFYMNTGVEGFKKN